MCFGPTDSVSSAETTFYFSVCLYFIFFFLPVTHFVTSAININVYLLTLQTQQQPLWELSRALSILSQ